LLLVAGTAAGFSAIGLSMSLGAFVAGVLMSESEYRHQLKADIDPFEGLLLGFFFISVGAQTDVARLLADPGFVLAAAGVLVVVKAVIIFAITRATTQSTGNALRLAVALAQGSEFAFVLFTAATEAGAMSSDQARLAGLVVTLSMLASPVLFALLERWVVPRLEKVPARDYDEIDEANPVIICGIGRVGQIVARILQSRQIRFTALDNDAAQIDAVRRFGNKAYYGDSTRPELLRAAGAEQAKVLVIALDDGEKTLEVVRVVQRHFAHLKLVVRARNRRHAHLLMDQGVRHIIRETFYSSLMMGDQVLEMLDIPTEERVRTLQTFQRHDERTLVEQHRFYQDEKQLIQTTKQAAQELRGIFEADRRGAADAANTNAAGGSRGTPGERLHPADAEPDRLDPPPAARL
jgi:voltage-gated potassium channel Kch